MKCRTLEILHSERKTENGKKNEQSLKRAVGLKHSVRTGGWAWKSHQLRASSV